MAKIAITESSTLDDLLKKYSTLPEDHVRSIFNLHKKNPVTTDFELKEFLYEPVSESKKTNEIEMNETNNLEISQPLLSATVSENDGDTKNSSAGNEKRAEQLVSEFKEHHSQENISKEDLSSIVEVIREGNKSGNIGEEKFLSSQYANDLYLIQLFIHEKVEEQKVRNFANNGVNVHNKNDFPTLVTKIKQRVHLIIQRRKNHHRTINPRIKEISLYKKKTSWIR